MTRHSLPDQSSHVVEVLLDSHQNRPLGCRPFWFPFQDSVIYAPFHRIDELHWRTCAEMHSRQDSTAIGENWIEEMINIWVYFESELLFAYIHWHKKKKRALTSRNWTKPSSPSSETQAYAASLCRKSWHKVISSLRNNDPIFSVVNWPLLQNCALPHCVGFKSTAKLIRVHNKSLVHISSSTNMLHWIREMKYTRFFPQNDFTEKKDRKFVAMSTKRTYNFDISIDRCVVSCENRKSLKWRKK